MVMMVVMMVVMRWMNRVIAISIYLAWNSILVKNKLFHSCATQNCRAKDCAAWFSAWFCGAL
jgi:hypothetical protein